jgi:16S rRNA (uracil1498-N3)-methyltransferase
MAGRPDCRWRVRLALLPEAVRSSRELRFTNAGGLLVVGPEGGLGERDISALKVANFEGLRLGPRILRTETAGLAALAALQASRRRLIFPPI